MLLISKALYASRAACMSNVIRFSLVRHSFDIIWNILLGSVNMCTSMSCFNKNYSCLWIASTSSNEAADAITSADINIREICCDSYDLWENSMELLSPSF